VSPRYTIELSSGDSLIVEAAKQVRGQGPDIFPPNIEPSLLLGARLFVNGAETTPNAGTVESSSADGAGISFNNTFNLSVPGYGGGSNGGIDVRRTVNLLADHLEGEMKKRLARTA